MRPHLVVLAAALAVAAFATAADERPQNVRVSVQFIEVAHPALTAMLAGADTRGPQLHDQALALVKTAAASVLETCVVTTLPNQKASLASIRELIYPTEYEPPGSVNLPPRPPSIRPALDAFETRHVGSMLEIEPSLQAGSRLIDLRLVPEIVQLVRMDTWMEHVDRWGDASVRRPVFEKSCLNTRVTLLAGQFEMVGVITPKPNTPGPATTRKLLVFVRADILPAVAAPAGATRN